MDHTAPFADPRHPAEAEHQEQQEKEGRPLQEAGIMNATNGRKVGQPEVKPSVDHTAIAKVLIEFRLDFQLTKQEMVDLLLKYEVMGINWTTYHRWESSRQRPRALTEKVIRNALRLARQQPSSIEAIRRR